MVQTAQQDPQYFQNQFLSTPQQQQPSRTAKRSKEEDCCVSFNKTRDCFIVGGQRGFRVYSISSTSDLNDQSSESQGQTQGQQIVVTQNLNRELNGGIGIAEMVDKTNIFALVGGGESPKWPPNKLIIWDDLKRKIIGEISFASYIKSVKINQNVLVVVLYSRTYIYNFLDLTLIDCLDTSDNPWGVCELTLIQPKPQIDTIAGIPLEGMDQPAPYSVIAALSSQEGVIRLRKLVDRTYEYDVPCHLEPISAIGLSPDGKHIATACEGGMYIRVWRWQHDVRAIDITAPISLYMLQIAPIEGFQPQVRMLQMCNEMSFILAKQVRGAPERTQIELDVQNQQQPLRQSMLPNGTLMDLEPIDVYIYRTDHAKESYKGQIRSSQMDSQDAQALTVTRKVGLFSRLGNVFTSQKVEELVEDQQSIIFNKDFEWRDPLVLSINSDGGRVVIIDPSHRICSIHSLQGNPDIIMKLP